MAFVLDASIAIVWFLPDELSPIADNVLRRVDEGAYVPDLFWHEIRNILITSYRRKRLPREDIMLSMLRLSQLKIVTSSQQNSAAIIDVAERHGLTAYDAAYLSLAIEKKLPLATLDKQLITAAPHEGVELLS